MSRKRLVTLGDGTTAWVDVNELASTVPPKAALAQVNDLNLGFTPHSLAEMEAERDLHGFKSSIEFKKDPELPWYSVHASGPAALKAWAEHRGLSDYNSRNGSGAMLPEGHIDDAARRVREKYGVRKA